MKHCGLSGRSITWVVNKAVKEFLDQPTSTLIALPRTRMVNQAVVKFLEQEEDQNESSEGPVATGEPGKAAASDNLLSPVHPRPDATCAERTGSLALSRTEEPRGPEPDQPEHLVHRG